MGKCLAAHTNPGSQYPGYINFTLEDDGTITVHFRGNPSKVEGCYVCVPVRDKAPGRCTPGDENCNNYCNLAPEKGPMQKHPADCTHIREGATASLTLSPEDFGALNDELRTFVDGAVVDDAVRDASVALFRERLQKRVSEAAARIKGGA